jgi:hypothetical protein
MANMKHFSGDTEIGIMEEVTVAEFNTLFPGRTAIRRGAGYRVIGLPVGVVRTWDRAAGKWSREGFLPVERSIQRKSNPSNHKCGPRCLNATGFQCECQCNGKNHGAGNFMCVAEAA